MSHTPPLFTRDMAEREASNVRAMGERAYRPSNGTEGDMFMERWCFRCTKDDAEHERYCPIIARSMAHEVGEDGYPGQWIIGDDGQPRCTAFERDWGHP
jgi:hypothetical protein